MIDVVPEALPQAISGRAGLKMVRRVRRRLFAAIAVANLVGVAVVVLVGLGVRVGVAVAELVGLGVLVRVGVAVAVGGSVLVAVAVSAWIGICG